MFFSFNAEKPNHGFHCFNIFVKLILSFHAPAQGPSNRRDIPLFFRTAPCGSWTLAGREKTLEGA